MLGIDRIHRATESPLSALARLLAQVAVNHPGHGFLALTGTKDRNRAGTKQRR